MEQKLYDTAIIGGGPGGYTAALYCARAGLSTVVVEKLSPGGQMATTDWVENYPGFPEGVNGFELGMKMQESAQRFGAETLYGEVTGLTLDSSPKTIAIGESSLQARTVILSTGASPRELGLPGEQELRGRGVSYCATCDGMFYRDQTVAIVGGGNTAVADALYLARICKKVYLIHRRDTLRASRVYLEPLKSRENIEFVLNRTVAQIKGGEKVESVLLSSTTGEPDLELAVDGLFVAIGFHPNTELFEGQLELEGGYIKAGENCRTSIPGVFAAGDVRTKEVRQLITAAADGAVAGVEAGKYLA